MQETKENNSKVTCEENIKQAINEHGIFFKKGIRLFLEKIPNVTVISEEHAAEFMEGCQIDLLIKYSTKSFKYIIPIECKRTSKKEWVFFNDMDNKDKYTWTYSFQFGKEGTNGTIVERNEVPVCIEGAEVENSKVNDKTIYNIGMQTSKNFFGFISQEHAQRNKSEEEHKKENFFCFPIVITNTPLLICEPNLQLIDIKDGNYKGSLDLQEEGWLILRYPFVPKEGSTSKYVSVSIDAPFYLDPKIRSTVLKNDITIINSNYLKEFFLMLDKTDEENVKKHPYYTIKFPHF